MLLAQIRLGLSGCVACCRTTDTRSHPAQAGCFETSNITPSGARAALHLSYTAVTWTTGSTRGASDARTPAGTGILNRVLLPLPPRPARLACLVLLASLAVVAATVSPASAVATGLPAFVSASPRSANEQSTAGVTPRWAWPIAAPRTIVRPFAAPETAYSSGHRGIDLAAAEGVTVFAPADGVIHFSGIVVDRPVLSIEHAGSLLSSFDPVSSALPAGTIVRRGEAIGTVAARAGHCGSSCLHFGVRLHGQYLSPLNFLGGIAYPVLLPTRALR